jgi:DoxX-like family
MQAPELHGLTGWATIGFARSIVNKLLFETTPFTNASSRGCLDKPARAGRATQIAAMVITGLVAFIWVYFGRLYLIHDPDEWRIANQQLGYPLYIIPLIGVTHILGGVGLLIPNMPRLLSGFMLVSRSIFYSRSIHN